ncbi:MAG TPA: DUF4268 domain-containing protein [Candidatus Paceibacterota bacterium]|nr:DUF4268 domain-containing protein [Candidatus Paceibacterota bacterium]
MLGKVEKVDLRKAWPHEALDFTRWLAEEANLRLLSEELGIELVHLETEAGVGRYNVDILAEELGSGKKIIIENQLEITNHDHLGKLITYASGYDANMVIWVVRDAREEHRQAIDWLNEHTDENLAFFLVQLELWQIGNSPFAPKFNIISKPNDWAKVVKRSFEGGEITETKAQQLRFWNAFQEYAKKEGVNFRFEEPQPKHWFNIYLSTHYALISLSLNSFERAIRTEFYIRSSKELYTYLEGHRETIEKEIGAKLVWMPLEGKKASRIKIERTGDIDEERNWEEYFAWCLKQAQVFARVFPKYIKEFDKNKKSRK